MPQVLLTDATTGNTAGSHADDHGFNAGRLCKQSHQKALKGEVRETSLPQMWREVETPEIAQLANVMEQCLPWEGISKK